MAKLKETKTPPAGRQPVGRSPLPPTVSARQSRRKMAEIKNSSDVDSGLDEKMDLPSGSRPFKEVAVPILRLHPDVPDAKPGTGPSSVSSGLSSACGMSYENYAYDTPGTSAVPTPAEFTVDSRKSTRLGNAVGMNFTPQDFPGLSSVTRSNSLGGKRKRATRSRSTVGNEDQIAADELLAQALQDEEYASMDQYRPAAKKGRRNGGRNFEQSPAGFRTSEDYEDEPLAGPSRPPPPTKRRPRASIMRLEDESDIEESLFPKKHTPRRRRNTKSVMPISDEDEIMTDDEDAASFSPGPELTDEEMASAKQSRTQSKGAIKNRTFALPARTARAVARRSIAGALETAAEPEGQIDDSGLSEYESGLSDPGDTDLEIGTDLVVGLPAGTVGSPAALRAERMSYPRLTSRQRAMQTRARKERTKLESAHPEILTLWDDLRAIPIITPQPAEQPTAITRKLKSFQLEGLYWMCQQEKSKWKGGLLGDEMGMGKTIQAVSLIMSDYPAKEPTLVVVPPVALMQWQNEIKEYTNGVLNVLVHHNTDPRVKKLTLKELKKYDVIMISYSGLESIHRKESKGWKRDDCLVKENSKIHAITFHRLILDEAHSIKTRTTGVARACFALKSKYKWCLSGTPVQNRIGEFFSLLRFLEVTPFACYFCKACACAELHWSQNEAKKCSHCNHSGFNHVSIFNQELLAPITQGDDPELRRAALGKLRLITDRIMLRRMKRDYTAAMELPPKEVIIHNEFFGEIERDFSSSIMQNTTRQFDTYVSRGVMLNNYANIFGLIMQMRQVANHPDLILKRHAEGGQNVLVCSICDEAAEEPIRSRCHHEFCRSCAKDYVRSFEGAASGEPDCPRCHIPLAIDFDQPDIEQDQELVKKNSIINRIKMEDWTSSTKIEMLIYDLYKLRSRKQTHKSIVFSQFTSMLQLVEWRLHRAGFNTVMLDGSMSPAQRQRSIEYFMTNVDVEVFLVSLKAGGVALNLTEASRVFIIDPWWNPAAEWQSADRCHRIGQKRPCVITRLCIEDSVESRMVMLQEKKANMIAGAINNDTVAMEKLTPEDMQFLFRGS